MSYDEFIDAKAFYYTDTNNPSHPYNLINGPLDKCHTHYTEMWVMKMRKVFNSMDRQKKGKVTAINVGTKCNCSIFRLLNRGSGDGHIGAMFKGSLKG